MKATVGTGRLIRLFLRRERNIAPWWIGVLLLMAAETLPQYGRIFATQAARDGFAHFIRHNAMLVGFGGPLANASLAGLAAWKIGDVLYTLAAMMAVLTVIRHTRREEESGRLELLASGEVGRLAPLTASVVIACGLSLFSGAFTTLIWMAQGQEATGSQALGLAIATSGCVFAAIGALAAQLSASARTSTAVGLGALAAAWGIRFMGDASQHPWMSWFTPLGWSHLVEPFGINNLWVLLVSLAATLVLGSLAGALNMGRDLGLGLIPAKPGPAHATRLGSSLAIAWRLQRGPMLAWAVAYFLAGLFVGNVASSGLSDLGGHTAWGSEFLARFAGDAHSNFSDMLLWVLLVSLGYTATLYALLGALQLHSEEMAGHAAWVLSTGTSRTHWMAAHIVWLMIGTTAIMLAGGLGLGLSYGVTTGHGAHEILRMLAGGLIQVPAIWTIGVLALLAFGWLPRGAVWVAWAAFFYVNLFGEVIGPLLGLTYSAANLLVPFYYLPKLTSGAAFNPTPPLLLLAIAAVFSLLGLWGFSRRDLLS